MALSTMSAAAQAPAVPREKLNVIKEFLDTKLTRETISDLHVHLKTLIKDWYEVGLSLKVPIETLDEIDADQPKVFRKVVAMVVKWIDNTAPTWRVLFGALSRNGHLQVVKSILNDIKFFKKDEAVDQGLVEYILKDVEYHQMDLDMASLLMENIQVPHNTDAMANKTDQPITQHCQNICQILKVSSNDEDVHTLLKKAHIEAFKGKNLTFDQLRKVTCEIKVLSRITKEKAEELEKHTDVLQTTLEELSLIKKKIVDIKCDLENKLRKLSDIKSELSRLKSTNKSNELLLRMEENEQELLQTKQYLQRSTDILDYITSKNEPLTRELNKSLEHTQNAKIQSQKVSDFANSCYKTSKLVYYESNLLQCICLFIVYLAVHSLTTNQYWLVKIVLHILGHIIGFRMIETAPEITRKELAPLYMCIFTLFAFAQGSINVIWPIAILATGSIANLMKWTNFESLDNGGVFGTILTALIEPFLGTNSKTISVVLPIILIFLITAQTILHKSFPRKFPTAIINMDTASLGLLSPAIMSGIGNYFGDYLISENDLIIVNVISCWTLVRLCSSMKLTMIMTGILVLLLGISSNPTNNLIFAGYIFVFVAVISPIHQWFCVSYGSPSSQLERSTFECIEWLTGSLAILDNTEQIITRLKYELQHL